MVDAEGSRQLWHRHRVTANKTEPSHSAFNLRLSTWPLFQLYDAHIFINRLLPSTREFCTNSVDIVQPQQHKMNHCFVAHLLRTIKDKSTTTTATLMMMMRRLLTANTMWTIMRRAKYTWNIIISYRAMWNVANRRTRTSISFERSENAPGTLV